MQWPSGANSKTPRHSSSSMQSSPSSKSSIKLFVTPRANQCTYGVVNGGVAHPLPTFFARGV